MYQRDRAARKLIHEQKTNSATELQFNELKLLKKRVKCQIKYDMKHLGNDVLRAKDDHVSIWNFIKSATFKTSKGSFTKMDPFALNEYFSSVVREPSDYSCAIPDLSDSSDSFQLQTLPLFEVERSLASINVLLLDKMDFQDFY